MLFEKGHRLHPSPWMTLNWLPSENGKFRCGWTIPGKVGSSVLRNRLKRWLRECVRKKLKEGPAPGVDVNFLIRARDATFYKKLSLAEFERTVDKAWRKLPLART